MNKTEPMFPIEGYIFRPQTENFVNHQSEIITVWRDGSPQWGMAPIHVTLSPADEKAKEPDYEAMWRDLLGTELAEHPIVREIEKDHLELLTTERPKPAEGKD